MHETSTMASTVISYFFYLDYNTASSEGIYGNQSSLALKGQNRQEGRGVCEVLKTKKTGKHRGRAYDQPKPSVLILCCICSFSFISHLPKPTQEFSESSSSGERIKKKKL